MIKKIFLLLIVFSLISCGSDEKNEDSKPTVSVSILPQKYFVEQIAGDLFSINVMIPPGASPATYEPTPAQLTALTKTDLYMKMGYTGFEMSWMEKLISINKTMKVVNLSDDIDLIMEKHQHHDGDHVGSVDPHVWLSPKNAKVISKNILQALSDTYPKDETVFMKNYQSLLIKLDSLDTFIEAEMSSLTKRSFITYHPSLSYFSRDYNLNQYPMELEGKTPSSAYLKQLVDTGKSENIQVIFLQMQFDQHNAEVIAKEIGAEIVQINPLDPEWYKQMKFITKKLTEKL